MKRLIYDVPRWNCFLHRDARGLEAASSWDKPLQRLEDELFDRLYSGEPELLPKSKQDRQLGDWAKGLHDAFGALPAFARLAEEVQGDAQAAGTAVETLVNDLKPQLPEPAQVPAPPLQRRAVTGACQKASEAVEEMRDLVEGMQGVALGAPGGAPGKAQVTSGDVYRSLASRLKDDQRLRRIALLAGRFKRIAAAKQRQKVKHGAEEVTDVEQGGEISRLLPSELAKFARPKLKLALQRDILEKQAMQYRLSGTEVLGKGPLVCCLDKSGSMDGPPDIWATAVALALLDIAQRQRRPFALLAFNAVVVFETVVKIGRLLPEAGLFVRCDGGTSIAAVITRSLELIQKDPGSLRKADVVLITDGGSDASTAPELRQTAHQLGVTLLGLGIGVDPTVLAPWCDHVQAVSSLDGMDDATAESLFSV